MELEVDRTIDLPPTAKTREPHEHEPCPFHTFPAHNDNTQKILDIDKLAPSAHQKLLQRVLIREALKRIWQKEHNKEESDRTKMQ